MNGKRILTAALLLLCAGGALSAQKGNIGFIYPAGAQRGTTVEVAVGGQGLAKATEILFSGEGLSGELIPAAPGQKPRKKKNRNIGEEDNLQLADVVRFRVHIDASAQLGMHDVRLVLPGGTTNRLYFEVGQLPDVLEDGRAELSAYSATLPVTFNGQVLRADTDRFRFRAKKGQRLVLSAKGRVFVPYMADAVPGWFQPVMHLYDATGREVAFSDDYTFHVDPVIFYEVPRTGDYEVEIYDGLYRGREDFVYRIDVGELPFITSIYPVGGVFDETTPLQVRGWNLPGEKASIRPSELGRVPFSVKGKSGLISNTVWFQSDTCEEVKTRAGAENSAWGSALPVREFDAFNGRLTRPLQEFWFVFRPQKSRRWHFEAVARRVGSPADLRLSLFDASGELIGHYDDLEDASDYMNTHHADPQATLKLEAGRPVYIRLTEAQGHCGEDYAFRFFVTPSQPDFSLGIEPAVFSVPAGGTGVFNVVASRKQGFSGPIDLRLEGIPAGYKVAGARIEKGMNRTIVTVTAPKKATPRTFHPELIGRAKAAGKEIERPGLPAEEMMQAFYYKHMMPVGDFRMEVGEALPFTLTAEVPSGSPLRLSREMAVPIRVRIHRNPGYDQPVTVMLRTSGSGARAEAIVVPGDQEEATLEVTLKAKPAEKKDKVLKAVVYGVVKGSSKKLAGKGRSAYVASATAYTPVFEVLVPSAKEFVTLPHD